MGYSAGQSGVEKAAYFYGYGWLRTLALRGGGGQGELSTVADLGLGYLAEVFHLPFTIPIEVGSGTEGGAGFGRVRMGGIMFVVRPLSIPHCLNFCVDGLSEHSRKPINACSLRVHGQVGF